MNDPASGSSDRSQSTLKGWYRRGERHPPHFDAGSIPQFITFRLAGSLPQEKLLQWKQLLRHRRIDENEFHRRIEEYLDAGAGDCWLRDPRIAGLTQDAVRHFDGQRYELHGWVIMPNHVHTLITPTEGRSLPEILHSWKSFSAKRANQMLGRNGSF